MARVNTNAKKSNPNTNKKEKDMSKKQTPKKELELHPFEGLNTKESATEFIEMLKDLEDAKPDELSMAEMTGLALTLIKPNEVIEWKPLVARFNEVRGSLPQASMYSDPSAGKHDGWNMRNQLWNAEHKEDSVLHIIKGLKSGAHAKDGGRGTLRGLAIMPKTAAALKANAALVGRLHKKFFGKAKATKKAASKKATKK